MIPGRTENTPRDSRTSINSSWLNKFGRGPTKLISPTRTFHNWGSSSNLDLRKNPPKGVMDEELAKWVATDGAFTCMERNFIKLKGFLPFPTRFCRNIADPVSKYPIMIKTNKIGLKRTRPMNENRTSKIRVTSYRMI